MFTINKSIEVKWYGHSCVKLEYNSRVIFIDPLNIGSEKADYIMITHFHPNHYSLEDIQKLKRVNTLIVAPVGCPDEIPGSVISMKPNTSVTLHEITITAMPAYNLGGKPYHPRSKNWIGYILEIAGTRIYHSGDTDDIPEMKNIKNIDLALLPVSGRSVMNARKAADAANSFKPRVVIPIHWDHDKSYMQDAAIFKKLFKGNTFLMKPEN